MSAHILLNLLNEFGKRDKMRGLPSILSLFHSVFSHLHHLFNLFLNKYNST